MQQSNKLAIINRSQTNLSAKQDEKLNSLFVAEVAISSKITEKQKQIAKLKEEILKDTKIQQLKKLKKELKAFKTQHHAICENKNGALAVVLADFRPDLSLGEKLELMTGGQG